MRLSSIDPRLPAAAAMLVALVSGASPGRAANQLEPHTLAAFNRYAQLTEQRVLQQALPTGAFLYIDHLPSAQRRRIFAALRRGEMYMEPLVTLAPDGSEVEVEDGLIHHWLGVVFIPGASLVETLALVQDYDRHEEIYGPAVADARILQHDAGHYRVFMRFHKKKVITVVMDTVHEVDYVDVAPGRTYSISRTSSVREVESPGEAGETVLPDGTGTGFLWRLNSYWRFQERDGGTYVECESISLTRTIPFMLRWLVGPFVNDVPREQLADLLTTTRDALRPQ